MSGHIYANSYFLGTAILGKNLVFTDTTKRYFDAVAGTVDSLYSNTPVIYTLADVSTYDINTNIVTYSSDFEIKAAVNFDLTASVSTINEINSNGD